MTTRNKTRHDREDAENRGRRAEFFAAFLLMLKGYVILETRFRTPVGEIDLVARRGKLIAFVEVKARKTLDEAAWSVSRSARRRIAAAAGTFMARRSAFADHDMRYDVMAISGWRHRHIKNAWIDGD